MTESQKEAITQHHSEPALQPAFNNYQYRESGLNVVELVQVLWRSKLQIIAISALFVIIAAIYALTAQEWWSSKAKIIEPQMADYSELIIQTKQFQPVFDIYQQDGTVLQSEELDKIVDPERLFSQFIYGFNSQSNKKAFLANNTDFQQYLSDNQTKSDEAISRTLEHWFSKVRAVLADKNKEDIYSLSFQATSSEESYRMLTSYIDFVSHRVYLGTIASIKATLSYKKNELKQKLVIFESQAENQLDVEIQRSQYALNIANAANVDNPLTNFGTNEIFAINLGSKALAAKVKALKSVENLSVLDPRIEQVKAKLKLLNATSLKENMEFKTFRFLENVEKPNGRDEPKRSLIVMLAAFLGAMLGIVITLMRHTLKANK